MEVLCEKCNNLLNYVNEIPEFSTNTYVCHRCTHVMLIYYGVWHCDNQECEFNLCNLCKEGLKTKCIKCKGDLEFTKILIYINNKFRCDQCGLCFNVEEGVHHCFNCDLNFDVCIECRSKML